MDLIGEFHPASSKGNHYALTAICMLTGFHRFLKATVGKEIQKELEWDDLVWKATSTYNFFPTESSGISPFFLMFGHEAAAKHVISTREHKICWRQ